MRSSITPLLIGCLLMLSFSVLSSQIGPPTQPGEVVPVDPITGLEEDVPPRTDDLPCYGYTEPGSTYQRWDWRAESFTAWVKAIDGPGYSYTAESPFYSTSPNVKEFGYSLNGQPRDFQPTDGWELLYYDLGNEVFPVAEPSFAIYNRLDGKVVIFYHIQPDGGNVPTNVFIGLQQDPYTFSGKITGYFETLNIPSNPADAITDMFPGGFAQLNEGIANSNWYYAEGIMNYDPCVCDYETGLVAEPVLTNVQKLSLTIQGTGTSTAIYEKPSASSNNFLGNAISTANGIVNALSGGYKEYKSFGELNEAIDSSASGIQVLAEFLPLDLIPGSAAVLKVLGFLVGKQKPQSPPKLTGFDHTFSLSAEGELIDEDKYTPYPFYSPGSKFDVNQLSRARPIYDNPLGTFTILERPTVEFYHETFFENNGDEVNRTRYHYTGDLLYRINQSAGLSELPVSIAASLVWPDQCTVYSGGQGREVPLLASPTINLSCLDGFAVNLQWTTRLDVGLPVTISGVECLGEPQLQLIATLQEEGGSIQTLFSARYPLELKEVDSKDVDWKETLWAWVDPAPSQACVNDAPPRPVNDADLFRFCQSRYDPILALPVGDQPTTITNEASASGSTNEALATEVTTAPATVFPNPVRHTLWLDVPAALAEQNLVFDLVDLTGTSLLRTNRTFTAQGRQAVPVDWDRYPAGMYLLTVSAEDGYRHTFRITKN